MDPVVALTRLGGIASARDLLALTTRKRLRRAVEKRDITHVARNRYALRSADEAIAVAMDVDGHLRLLSAAAHWGWKVKWPARFPQILVTEKPEHPVKAEITCGVAPCQGWSTTPLQTVLDCAAELPFDEALAVADSALRHGNVTRDELDVVRSADPAVQRVLEHASKRAANPFESVLRAILIEAGIAVVPQWATTVGGITYTPDLADPFRGIAIEANSWAHHAGKTEHNDDCLRYNALVVGGWIVLRFTWEQVMFEPHTVVATVRAVIELRAAAA